MLNLVDCEHVLKSFELSWWIVALQENRSTGNPWLQELALLSGTTTADKNQFGSAQPHQTRESFKQSVVNKTAPGGGLGPVLSRQNNY